jgi:peptidoglycan L-alanyl-D-glutamate endopeptidase CwlK
MHVFGPASEARLATLHPKLVAVTRRALQLSPIDFMIMEGARSDEQCFINFGKGRTAAQCVAGGCPAKYAKPSAGKVTWLGHALSSNHRKSPDGFGHAEDIYPYPVSQVLGHKTGWEPLFDQIAKAMFAAAKELSVPIRWGADWDLDNMPRERGETDNPHFELR